MVSAGAQLLWRLKLSLFPTSGSIARNNSACLHLFRLRSSTYIFLDSTTLKGFIYTRLIAYAAYSVHTAPSDPPISLNRFNMGLQKPKIIQSVPPAPAEGPSPYKTNGAKYDQFLAAATPFAY